MLNLHNLTEEVANTQTERAGRRGQVRAAAARGAPPGPARPRVWRRLPGHAAAAGAGQTLPSAPLIGTVLTRSLGHFTSRPLPLLLTP